MARIRTRQNEEAALQGMVPRSLIIVSDMLYERIRREVVRKVGKGLRLITAKYLMAKYWGHLGKGAIIGMHPEMLTMAVLRNDPQLALIPYEVRYTVVTARLRFPIAGEAGHVNQFLEEVIAEHRLKSIRAVWGEFEVNISLIDGDEPVIDVRHEERCHGVGGNGRKAYCCARELWW